MVHPWPLIQSFDACLKQANKSFYDHAVIKVDMLSVGYKTTWGSKEIECHTTHAKHLHGVQLNGIYPWEHANPHTCN